MKMIIPPTLGTMAVVSLCPCHHNGRDKVLVLVLLVVPMQIYPLIKNNNNSLLLQCPSFIIINNNNNKKKGRQGDSHHPMACSGVGILRDHHNGITWYYCAVVHVLWDHRALRSGNVIINSCCRHFSSG